MTPRSPLRAETPDGIDEIQARLADLESRLAESEIRLAEAQEVVRAIQAGEVDAVVVSSPQGEQIFTLKGAEYAYRSLVEAMNEGAAMLGIDETVLYCNQRLSELLGAPIEQIIGQHAGRLFTDGTDGFQRTFNTALEGLAVKTGMDLRTADGRRIPIQISLRRMTLEEPAALAMVVTDLSESKKQEDSLREMEEAFTIMAHHVSKILWMSDANGLAFYYNRRAVEYTGLNLAEIYGDGWIKVIHPDDQGAARNAWNRAVESGMFYKIESRLRAADGSYRWFLLQAEPIRNSEGKILRWCGICTDIDLLKLAEREQRTQRRIIERVINGLPCGVGLVRGSDLTFQLINPAYQAFAPGRTILGRSVREVWSEEGPEFVDHCLSVLKTGEPLHAQDQEFMVRRSTDGPLESGCFSWSISRLPLPDNDEDGILLTVWDTTQRKRTEQALQLQSMQLRALSERTRQVREEERKIVARDLHDRLGQVLTAVKMDVSWIARHASGTPLGIEDRLARSIELIDEGSQTVRKICRGLRPPDLDDLGLAAAIESEARDFMSRSGIACTVNVPDGHVLLNPEIAIVLFRIAQECLTNVMRHAQATSVHIDLECGNDRVRLKVADNGKGFLETQKSGSLGLLGMKERAQSCGGELSIDSSPGRGTTVTVVIPLH